MNQISSALLESPAPTPAQHGKEPPGSPPDTPFAAVLDNQARTAAAEGRHRQDEDRPTLAERDAPEPVADPTDERAEDTATAKPTSPDEAALAALLGGVPLPANVVVTAPAAHGDASLIVPARSPAPASGAPNVVAGGSAASSIDESATPMPTGPAVPAAASALPLRPTAAAILVVDQTAIGAEPAAVAANSMPGAAARATRLADVLQAAAGRPGAAGPAVSSSEPASLSAATVAGAANAASGRFAAQSRATASVAATSAAPTATPTAAGPLAQGTAPAEQAATPTRAVGLEHAVETVRLALRAGAERGVTHARISLTPRELGTIEIHLRQTSDGLVARVVAEHASAVQQLQHAGADLRRQLEQSGLTLLRLDIGASGEQGDRAADRQALANGEGAFGDGEHSRHGARDADPLTARDGATDLTTTTATLALPNGALVDVLA
ncbi:MAG TPA: flagellar hook-length control protein FliK [Conexibacter sp.]|nr:flagellar hook-length control protein FliK [Conexibacter sp.]